ncbi:hypothetical protein PIB30_070842 [Stylosanthes scabra]|uniref:Uncharacterized protein n=1 Tax=Stylosanthes scabra TaxID=79078 RepID=A0ABU6QQT2_9FABA|nr:hypothetical protein [Stylosanthes scabra]
MPVPTANELIRSVIRPSRSGPEDKQRRGSLKPSHRISGVALQSKEDNRAKGHHTPPPISQGLRGNITRPTRRKTGLRGLMPPPQLSLGFTMIYPSYHQSSSLSFRLAKYHVGVIPS